MALALNDRVQQQGTANTTVSFTLTGSVTGFQSFAVVGNGNTTYYGATDASGNWEVGVGTYSTTGPTLTRTTILASSNSGSAVTFSGTVNIFVTYPAEKSVNLDGNGVATIGSTLSYSDTGIIGSFASTVAGYNQVIVQNKSNATNASSNLNVSNDTSTATSGYAELGINSSTFSGTGSFNIAGAAYLASASTDLSIGTYGAYNVHFLTNSSNTDAMTIFNSGGVSLGGQPDPGLGTLYANNVYLGFNTITAAAGTTILTNSSSGWQQVVGTTTQTIQLPNATTLYKGLAYTIANNSTGAVTIKDNASTTIDTTVTGGSSILVLTNNSTSAGTWVAYSYIPSTYDFSTTTANFGNATITNALWNGTTIGTGYGGTGLTTFSAANNAIYSTSSSALAAGTLPVAAGGTGTTTLTGYVYGNGTGAFTASTTIPTSALTGNYVSTFSGGSTGLTPNTATAGAITLAGTLATGYGGTGLTTFTSGGALYAASTSALTTGTLPVTSGGTGQASVLTQYGVLYASTTSAMATSAAGTSTQVLHGNAAGAPTWGAVSLTADVSGTLPITNGGTGQTTASAAFNALSPVTTTGDLIIGNGTNSSTRLPIGANTYVLTSNGTTASWAAASSGLTITASSTNSAFYIPFTSASSGTITGENINTSITVNPSTGALTAPEVVASNGLLVHSSTVSTSYSIPSGSNAIAAGPMTVASGASVTIPSGSRWLVL
jgi:hypothetical protein